MQFFTLTEQINMTTPESNSDLEKKSDRFDSHRNNLPNKITDNIFNENKTLFIIVLKTKQAKLSSNNE